MLKACSHNFSWCSHISFFNLILPVSTHPSRVFGILKLFSGLHGGVKAVLFFVFLNTFIILIGNIHVELSAISTMSSYYYHYLDH